ncbi:MAG TPA: hypothetical protein VFP59_04225 [Candidatus Angelobacter sp.]|nr:hypothetical protein [Candidatus Angelobacter sp.]
MRILSLFLLLAGSLWAQQSGVTNEAQKEPPDELGKFKYNCLFKHIAGCAELLFTGQPVHIAVGSIAPQNGFAAGLAYVGHNDTPDWSTSWTADAVASNNASWRAGVYLKFVDTRLKTMKPSFGTPSAGSTDTTPYPEQPVFNLYAQSISLNKLTFFGLGPDTTTSGRSFFGMTEHILGGNAIRPIYDRLNMGIYGEINGRAVDIRPSRGQPSSVEQLYNEAAAPGLTQQPFFLQLGGGLRIRPSAFNDLLHFNYDVSYRPFFAMSGPGFSFQRLTFDLNQEISLYRKNPLAPRDTNNPNDCRIDPSDPHSPCPPITSRSLQGSLGLRVYSVLSMTPGGDLVPFYFQPTLGGSDINGNSALSSYQDYRFRAPNLLLFQEKFEHSIGYWPVGFILRADQGKVALARGDLGSNHWVHSYATGLTLRAGGFPEAYLLFAWGGSEGTHTIGSINTSLLGSSARPSLY